MQVRNALTAAMAAIALLTAAGCARAQETVGAYIDAAAISVETLNGTVMLSGFAKNEVERGTAERIARAVNGVKAVKNEIAVRP